MNKKHKAIIIGTSLTGKTTLIKYLRGTTDLIISEIDEELTLVNNGVFPSNVEYKNSVLAPKIKKKILLEEDILFFSNAQYFTCEELQIARQKNFKIIQLTVDKEELIKRNRYRMKNEGYEDHSKWFDSMLQYQENIREQGLVDYIVKTDTPVEETSKVFLEYIEK